MNQHQIAALGMMATAGQEERKLGLEGFLQAPEQYLSTCRELVALGFAEEGDPGWFRTTPEGEASIIMTPAAVH